MYMNAIKNLILDLWLFYMGYRWVLVPSIPSGEQPPWEEGTIIRYKGSKACVVVYQCTNEHVYTKVLSVHGPFPLTDYEAMQPEYYTRVHKDTIAMIGGAK